MRSTPVEARNTNLRSASELVLAVTRTLYVNGQSTDEVLATAESLGKSMGVDMAVNPRWGELQLQVNDGNETLASTLVAYPAGIDMGRVVSTMEATENLRAGHLTAAAASEKIRMIATAPPSPVWLFVIAAAAGAVSLAVLFGVQHAIAAALIAASAGLGAILRRQLTRFSTNLFLQPFCAALLAGIIGALAVRYQLSSSLRLVAVCPCMILVPGTHVLNGTIDLIKGRVHLGSSRLIYAGLVILAISFGLLLGLALLGASLPVTEPGRAVPFWLDILAAGVAVASFSVFFSSPVSMLAWPVAVGMLAHALRWFCLAWLGAGLAIGAFVACLAAGLILTPVAARLRMPFAAIGFASVVSMIPGVFLFRMASGLLQLSSDSHATLELIGGTLADGIGAFAIIFAMSVGIVVPKLLLAPRANRAMGTKS